MKKIIIIGLTGSGKTTLANKLGEHHNIPVYHLDSIFWKEKGGIKQDVFLKKQEEIMVHDTWIMDGSFPRSSSLDVRIQNADTIIFYDLPLRIVFWRQMKRYMKNYTHGTSDLLHERKWPLKWKDIKYALLYPRKEIYSKVNLHLSDKRIYIIKTIKDEVSFINTLQS